MTGDRASFVLLSEFPLTEKPRQVIVSLDDQHSVRTTLVWQTHPYPEHGLARTGKQAPPVRSSQAHSKGWRT